MSARWIHLFLDVPASSWDAALAFWPAALDATLSPPRGETGQFVTVLPAAGSPWVKLQRRDAGSARIHLDVDAPERAATVGAALAAGAQPAWTYRDVEVLRSPGGLYLCATEGDRRAPLSFGSDWTLDRVVIEVPAAARDAEVALWSALLGEPEQVGRGWAFAVPGGPTVALCVPVEPASTIRAFAEFTASDREALTRRHEALGASVLAKGRLRSLVRAPSGHLYRVVDA